jgi:hypothetical protein
VCAGQAEFAEDRKKDGAGPPVPTSTEGIAMFDLHLIRRGMRVVDATGDEVGQVDDIKMGDPAATTAKGQSQEYESFTDLLARTVSAGGELPTERRERLLRLGYVKVNARAGSVRISMYPRIKWTTLRPTSSISE